MHQDYDNLSDQINKLPNRDYIQLTIVRTISVALILLPFLALGKSAGVI